MTMTMKTMLDKTDTNDKHVVEAQECHDQEQQQQRWYGHKVGPIATQR